MISASCAHACDGHRSVWVGVVLGGTYLDERRERDERVALGGFAGCVCALRVGDHRRRRVLRGVHHDLIAGRKPVGEVQEHAHRVEGRHAHRAEA